MPLDVSALVPFSNVRLICPDRIVQSEQRPSCADTLEKKLWLFGSRRNGDDELDLALAPFVIVSIME
jgi:hypothetical protein